MKSSILLLLCSLTLLCGSRAHAAKEVFQRTKPHVNVGTLGAFEHGPTTLTDALAKTAGTPLETVLVSAELPDGTGTVVLEALVAAVESDRAQNRVHDFDEEGTVLNLMTGAVPMDGAILVVSAVDGPMPQTREHVLLARQAGVPAVVVYLNMDEGAYFDQVDRSEAAVRDLLSSAGYDGAGTRVIRGSATGALRGNPEDLVALGKLVEALDEATAGR